MATNPPNNPNRASQGINEVNQELGRIEDQLINIADRLSYAVRDAVREVKDEALSLGEAFEKNVSRSIKRTINDTDQLLSLTNKIYQGQAKLSDVQKAINRELLNQLSFERNISNLKANGIGNEKTLNKLLVEGNDGFKRRIDLLKQNENLVSQINKQVGALGPILKGLNKIPILGGLIDAESALTAASVQAAQNISNRPSTAAFEAAKGKGLSDKQILAGFGGAEARKEALQPARLSEAAEKAKVLQAALNDIGQTLQERLNDPLVRLTIGFGLLSSSLKVVFNTIKEVIFSGDRDIVSLQKNLFLSRDAAAELRGRLGEVGEEFKIVRAEQIKAISDIQAVFGLIGKINADNVTTVSRLTNLVGLQGDEAAKINFLAESTGKATRDVYQTQVGITQQISSQYGVQLNQKQVLKDLSQTSAYQLVLFKGSTDELGKTLAKARALGITLQDITKIQQSLLNFESSITAELEAELLLGKELNLEQARYYALTNNIGGLLEEINGQIGDFGDFTRLNYIQQESYANALGMSVEKMSDMLLLEQYRDATQAEINASLTEEQQKRLETLTIQEEFERITLRIKDRFTELMEGSFGSFVKGIANVLSDTKSIGAIIGFLAGVQLIKMVAGIVAMIGPLTTVAALASQTAVASGVTAASFNPLSIVGIASAIALLTTLIGAGVGAMMSSAESQGKTIPQMAKGGTVLEGGLALVGEEGPEILSLTRGARITPLSPRSSSSSGGSSSNDLLRELIAEQKETRNAYNKTLDAISKIQVVSSQYGTQIGEMTYAAKVQ